MTEQQFEIELPDGTISLVGDPRVMTPSPYSRFLADNLPSLNEQVIVDLGTGCGIQAIVALKRGAKQAYLLDNNPAAINLAVKNAERNSVGDQVIALPAGDMFKPLGKVRVDTIICNPASLPMPLLDTQDSPYYAGPEGRDMISKLFTEAATYLKDGGKILVVHTSLANLSRTLEDIKYNCFFQYRTRAKRMIPFRDFYNRAWFDELNGLEEDLYSLDGGIPYETLHLIEAKYEPQKRQNYRQGSYRGRTVTLGPDWRYGPDGQEIIMRTSDGKRLFGN